MHCQLELKNKVQLSLNPNSNIFISENAFEKVICKMVAILSQPNSTNLATALLWNNAQGLQFIEICSYYVMVNFTHILQGYIPSVGVVIWSHQSIVKQGLTYPTLWWPRASKAVCLVNGFLPSLLLNDT